MMLRLTHALALLWLLFAGPVQAGIVTVTVEASGRDPGDATRNALVEAIRQVNGVSVSSEQVVQLGELTRMSSGSHGSQSSTVLSREQAQNISTRSGGHLAGYRVLESRPSEYGHTVLMEVDVHQYVAPGIDTSNRRKLAVIPFGARLARADFLGPVTGDALAAELTQAVITQFVQARRFSILDRQSWAALASEHQLLASSATPISEKAKLGQMLGADYLVLGELVGAQAAIITSTQTLTGMQRSRVDARVALNYRIVIPATGEIRFADSLDFHFTPANGEGLDTRTAIVQEVARRMVGIALDRIYPMQVVATPAVLEVVLNQGGATLRTGEKLTLVEQGEALADPYSGESLGRLEHVVGTIEVTRIDGRVAYARAIGQPTRALRVGQLARRAELGQMSGSTLAVPAPSPRQEGVRLPFDR